MDGTHTVTVRTAHVVLAARIIQILGGTGQFAFSVTLCFWHPWIYMYYGYNEPLPLWTLVPVLCLAVPMVIIAAIGIFACKRPNDVHWHLMLALDYLSLFGACGSVAMVVLVNLFQYPQTLPVIIVLDISTAAFLAANLIPIIRTHRLQKRHALPPPNSKKETFYYMQDQSRETYQPDRHRVYLPPTLEVLAPHRQPSQAMSRADTQARWSGVSGTDTTSVYPGVMRSESAVPAYYPSGGKRSPRGSLAKESLSASSSVRE